MTRVLSEVQVNHCPAKFIERKDVSPLGAKEVEVRGANFLRKSGAPGAIPTRDLPLRSRIHEPFVFNSYEKA